MKIDMVDLKIICNQYDDKYGAYPESEYEGQGVFEFIEQTLKDRKESKKPKRVN